MFTLAHLSDPHLGPLPPVRWRDLASKRAFGYANWRRGRGAKLGPSSLAALVDDLRRSEPDHIAVTGDLINIGLPAEVEAARDWLEALGAAGDVTVVPGNHDAYLPGAIRRYSAAWAPVHARRRGRCRRRFPSSAVREPVALVGVSSAVATAPLMATGRIRSAQSEALAETLDDARPRGSLPGRADPPSADRRLDALAQAADRRERLPRRGEGAAAPNSCSTATTTSPALPRSRAAMRRCRWSGRRRASLHARARGRPGGSYLLYRIKRNDGGFESEMEERGAREPGGPVETLSVRRLDAADAARQTRPAPTQR